MSLAMSSRDSIPPMPVRLEPKLEVAEDEKLEDELELMETFFEDVTEDEEVDEEVEDFSKEDAC